MDPGSKCNDVLGNDHLENAITMENADSVASRGRDAVRVFTQKPKAYFYPCWFLGSARPAENGNRFSLLDRLCHAPTRITAARPAISLRFTTRHGTSSEPDIRRAIREGPLNKKAELSRRPLMRAKTAEKVRPRAELATL